MFKCKACGSNEFQLVIQPEYEGRVSLKTNEHDEVIVTAEGQEFIADLMFMNQFAVCSSCSGIKKWEYFFQPTAQAM